ncbi:COG2102: Predicted ATPases of PP-loop superfamily [hydrothermal vent metagenome]|uniref:COG2102: Predicted ATPases of PP-loop superfamily n=1 Tax=hydrothermal vent metagenome TaxID=652676 RepID=A0A3B0YG44_9ZZZZ
MISWSTGKDSAWAYYKISQQSEYNVLGLFCTVNKKYARTAMHAVRIELLQMQAESIGLPLEIIEIPYPCSNADYEKIMGLFIDKVKVKNIECFVFGDLFLEDIRAYREDQLKDTGITPVFPLWNIPTQKLAKEMIEQGLKAVVTCIDPKQIGSQYVGKIFDLEFLESLPEQTDPCGENGEFHSYVYEGPMFNHNINIEIGEVVERDGFVFADVVAKTEVS